MDLDEFISELADGDSNDREIDCLTAALREAAGGLNRQTFAEFEAELPVILSDNR